MPGELRSDDISEELRTQHATAKHKLVHLLRKHWNFSHLGIHVGNALGLRSLPRPDRTGTKPHAEALAENTKRALAGFLRTHDPPPGLEALRRKALTEFL